MVRYYGHYSNASRGLRQKKNLDDLIPSIMEPEDLKPKRTWARLIQKIYEVDPLTCPKCQGKMKIISFIDDEEVDREDPQAPWPLGLKGQTSAQGEGALRNDFHR